MGASKVARSLAQVHGYLSDALLHGPRNPDETLCTPSVV